MTSSASGSAPPQWPSPVEATPGGSGRGEALLAGIATRLCCRLTRSSAIFPMRNPPMDKFTTYTFWARPNGTTPVDPLKIAPPPALWPKHAARANFAPGKTLIDSTSGNTGIAYAMLGAALGFPVTLCVPENASPERKRILQAYGANIIYTDPAEGSDGAIKIARQYVERDPDLYFYADQYSERRQLARALRNTANEIWQQTEGRITHFVAMLGTTGTFVAPRVV